MAALPSFIQLMASLGLSDKQPAAETDPVKSPRSRAVSSPSPRYSPYVVSPATSHPHQACHKRKGSASSSSSLSDPESSPSLRSRKYRHNVSRSDSSSDIAADTPISTYVRRKTPSSSPVSPNFDSGYESSASNNHTPFSIPTLPVLLTKSPADDLDSPSSDCDGQMGKDQDYYRFILQRTGTRISAARAARREQIARRYALRN